jgi:hypothetical protein
MRTRLSPTTRISHPFAASIVALLALLPLTGLYAQTARQAARSLAVPLVEAPAQHKFALVVGAGDYKSLDKIANASSDADEFRSFLQTKLGFSEKNIVFLRDHSLRREQQPSFVNLVAAFDDFEKLIDANSVVTIFVSGHGVRVGDEDYVLALDAQDSRPENATFNGVSITALLKHLESSRPRFILACLDLTRRFRGAGYDANLPVPRQAVVFYAAGATQLSLDCKDKDFNQGVFTHFLTEGLQDKDAAEGKGEVTVDSLRRYLQTNVRGYVSREFEGARQVPDVLAPPNLGNATLVSLRQEPPPPPGRPTALAVRLEGTDRAMLSWTDNSTNEVGFVIERKVGTGAFTVIATTPANSTMYTDNGKLPANTEFVYRVCAKGEASASEFSNEATLKTPAAPPSDEPKSPLSYLEVSKEGNPKHFKTISEALRRAAPGARIMVYEGLYNESVVIDIPNVEIIGVKTPEVTQIFGTETGDAVQVRADGVVLKNFHIKGMAGRSSGGNQNQRSHGVHVQSGALAIENCIVTSDSLAGVYLRGRSRVSIRRCRVAGCAGVGVFVRDNAELLMENSEVLESGFAGVQVTHFGNLTIRNCKVSGNGHAGAYRLDGKTSEIKEFLKNGKMSGVEFSGKGSGLVEDTELKKNGEQGIDDETNGKVKRRNAD